MFALPVTITKDVCPEQEATRKLPCFSDFAHFQIPRLSPLLLLLLLIISELSSAMQHYTNTLDLEEPKRG